MAPAAKRLKVGVAGPSRGGLAELNESFRARELEQENAALRKQLAAIQAPTTKLTYDLKQHAVFLKNLQKAPAIELLDLSLLRRATKSYVGEWYPKWKPDSKLEAALAALCAAADKVKGVDFGNAKWASEEKYAKEFQKLLRLYKKSVTNVRVTIRAMTEHCETVKSVSQANWRYAKHNTPREWVKGDVLGLIGSMPKLTKLAIIFNSCGSGRDTYGGEFNPLSQKKKLFAKVNELEVYLTKGWCKSHLVAVAERCEPHSEVATSDEDDDDDDSCDSSEDEYKKGKDDASERSYESDDSDDYCRDRSASEHDDRLLDLLKYRSNIITFLDMKAVPRTATEPDFVKQLPGLTALRSISLRAELLPSVSDNMKRLESVRVLVGAHLAADTLASVVQHVASSRALSAVLRLELVAESARVHGTQSALLAAFAEHCRSLEVVRVTGSGWKEADLAALLDGGAPIRELYLEKCGALEEAHLPLVAALEGLRVVRLPSKLHSMLGAGAISRRAGLDVRWQ